MTTGPSLPKSLTQADFQLVADRCYRVASKIIRKGKAVESVLILGNVNDGKVKVLHSSFMPMHQQGKDMLVLLMQALLQHPELDFVAHVTEAWILSLKDGATPQPGISNHPDREEVVVFNIMSKDCQTVVLNPLHRNPNRLERGKVDFATKVKGRMVREPETKN